MYDQNILKQTQYLRLTNFSNDLKYSNSNRKHITKEHKAQTMTSLTSPLSQSSKKEIDKTLRISMSHVLRNWLELLGSTISNSHYVDHSDNELDQVTIKRWSSGNFNQFKTLTRPIRGFTDIKITQVLLTKDN